MKIFHDPSECQINVLDERFYTFDNKTFYPSVTTILESWPKGPFFEQWLKDVGPNADEIKRRAAEKGSRIHDAINMYLKGREVSWTKRYYKPKESIENGERLFKGDIEEIDTGEPQYSFDEWKMILKFVEFYETIQPEVIANEFSLISSHYELGGTVDLLCKINRELWLIDYKSSNYLHDSMELQLAAYDMMFNEINKDTEMFHVEHCGILWLNSSTRGPDKKGKKIQGKGWILKEWDRHYSDAFKTFQHLHAIWKEQHPNYKPKNMIYPDRIKLKSNVIAKS